MDLMLPSGLSDKKSDGIFHACLSPNPRDEFPDWWETMKIFISWSGETSHAIALALGDWIPSVIQAVEAYVPPEEARKGPGWADEISKALGRSTFGILCIDPGSVAAPWLNFEAGVLLKSLDVSKVVPLLVDVERSELDHGPLAQFPSVVYGKNEMYRMLEMINENTEKLRLNEERLQTTFELWWPKLALDIETVRGKGTEEIPSGDTPGDAPDAEPSKGPPVANEKRGKPLDIAGPAKAPERTVATAKKNDAKKTQEIEKPKKSASARPVLDEIEVDLLKVLYDPPGYTPVTAAAVGYKLDISAQKVREHLDHLERKNFVREHLFVGRPKEYSIAPKGKEYLTKNDLLNKRQDR